MYVLSFFFMILILIKHESDCYVHFTIYYFFFFIVFLFVIKYIFSFILYIHSIHIKFYLILSALYLISTYKYTNTIMGHQSHGHHTFRRSGCCNRSGHSQKFQDIYTFVYADSKYKQWSLGTA